MPLTAFEVDEALGNQTDDEILESLAVVGFALRFPQDADSPEGFWTVMEEKRCVMTEWPDDRIHLDAFIHRDESQSSKVRAHISNPITIHSSRLTRNRRLCLGRTFLSRNSGHLMQRSSGSMQQRQWQWILSIESYWKLPTML